MKINKKIKTMMFFALLSSGALIVSAQDQAAVKMDKTDAIKAGSPITFDVALNEPLPQGAHFDFRISPIAADEEVSLGGGEPLGDSRKHFRVSGVLPEGALPGEWHVSVVWLFLPGTGWTHNTLATNNLRFQVEGKPYAIPTKAEVVVVR